MEYRTLLVFGDSYVADLYPKSDMHQYFKPGAIDNCKGVTLYKLSLEKYCNNEIGRKVPREEMEYIPRYLCKTDILYNTENKYLREQLVIWDNIVYNYKDKDVDIILLIGHVDLYSLYYKNDDKYKTNFYNEFIRNYIKLITYVKSILPRSNVYIISMCPFLLKTGNSIVSGNNRNSDFAGMRDRTLIINNRLHDIGGKNFIDAYEKMWDYKRKDYKFEVYNFHKSNTFDSHINTAAFRNILREKLILTKKFYKEDIIGVRKGNYYAICKPSLCNSLKNKNYKYKVPDYLRTSSNKYGGYTNTTNIHIYINIVFILLIFILLYNIGLHYIVSNYIGFKSLNNKPTQKRI